MWAAIAPLLVLVTGWPVERCRWMAPLRLSDETIRYHQTRLSTSPRSSVQVTGHAIPRVLLGFESAVHIGGSSPCVFGVLFGSPVAR
ncbi:hypothetical protein [Granulicella pectinivorans]|uniref:hypothetical protein n=1 Tax=Granulicella pectinivorans TaxID=474950 RepID=UPI000B7D2668|nr:hypothetical protein [Granulicella pectinivorans]